MLRTTRTFRHHKLLCQQITMKTRQLSVCNGSEPIREVYHANSRVHVELRVNLSPVWNHRLVESQFVSDGYIPPNQTKVSKI